MPPIPVWIMGILSSPSLGLTLVILGTILVPYLHYITVLGISFLTSISKSYSSSWSDGIVITTSVTDIITSFNKGWIYEHILTKIDIKHIEHVAEKWLNRMIEFIQSRPAFQDAHWIQTIEARIIAVALALIAMIISFTHIYHHLRLFTMPMIQIYVIRILITCPVYALASSFAMFLGEYGATYIETLRDLYEAIVIYAFFNLILEYGGGETDCIYSIENDTPMKLPCPLCCMKRRPRDARLVLFYALLCQ